MSRVYLDHNATSPLVPEARDAVLLALDAGPLNAGSIHREGQRSRAMLRAARAGIEACLAPGELLFVGGATEANNLALLGATTVRRVWTWATEHPSVLAPVRSLGARGVEVHVLPVDGAGRIDPDSLPQDLCPTDLVAVAAANNEIGNLAPLDAIAAICAASGARLHVDAAQVGGRLDLQLPDGVATAALASHKAGGPVGVGALWLRRGVGVLPRSLGGSQERGRRAGTENVAGATGMNAAWQASRDGRWVRVAGVRDAFEATMVERGARVVGDPVSRLPNTSSLAVDALPIDVALMALDAAGIAASSGSACAAGSVERSHVIEALGSVPLEAAVLRFSFGPGHETLDAEPLAARVWAALAPHRGR
jgi:cysteine desulfurase